MKHLLLGAFRFLCLLDALAVVSAGAAEPPRMLFLQDAGHDATAPSGWF